MKDLPKILGVVALLTILVSTSLVSAENPRTRIISSLLYHGKNVLVPAANIAPETVLYGEVLKRSDTQSAQLTIEVKLKLGHDKILVYTELDEIIWELTPRTVGAAASHTYWIDTESYQDNLALTLIGKIPAREEFTAVQILSIQDDGVDSLLTIRIRPRAPTSLELVSEQIGPWSLYLVILAVPISVIAGIAILKRRRTFED